MNPKLRLYSLRSRLRAMFFGRTRGNALFEMTVLTMTASTILVLLAQSAILFFRASEVKNLAHLGSNYAAANPGFSVSTIQSYVLQNAPGDIASNPSGLTVTMNPSSSPRALGTLVTVTVTYSYSQSNGLSPNFMGLHFPSTLTGSDTGATQ